MGCKRDEMKMTEMFRVSHLSFFSYLPFAHRSLGSNHIFVNKYLEFGATPLALQPYRPRAAASRSRAAVLGAAPTGQELQEAHRRGRRRPQRELTSSRLCG